MVLYARVIVMISLVLSLFCGLVWADESDLIWSTYLGGTHDDEGLAIATDDEGYVYVSGVTRSSDFPITHGTYDTVYHREGDIFVAMLNPGGTTLQFSTFIGGSGL